MGDLLGSNEDRFAIEMGELNTNLIIIIINIKQRQICDGIFLFKLFLEAFILTNLRWNSLILETEFPLQICDGK